MQIGLVVSRDESITELAARLRKHSVPVSDIIKSEEANYLSFTDPDGNPIYVADSDLSVAQQRAPTATQFDRV